MHQCISDNNMAIYNNYETHIATDNLTTAHTMFSPTSFSVNLAQSLH